MKTGVFVYTKEMYEPVVNASVHFIGKQAAGLISTPIAKTGTTDADGYFSVDNSAEGTFVIDAIGFNKTAVPANPGKDVYAEVSRAGMIAAIGKSPLLPIAAVGAVLYFLMKK